MWRDVRLVLRGFRRSPTFAVTAVLILGLGIGIATAMWTVMDAVLRRPLPVADQNRIILLHALDAAGVDVAGPPQWLDKIRKSSRTMRDMAGIAHWGTVAPPLMDGDHSIVLNQAQVTGNFFDVLGAHPVLGRLLRPEDDSTSHVMVLSYGAWQRQFGGDPAILGRRIIEPYQNVAEIVVGVAPPGLDYPVGTDCWIPLWWSSSVDAIARLAPGASMSAARSEFTAAMRTVASSYSVKFNIVGSSVRTLHDGIAGDARQTIIVLTAAVALLLLIACVNVGNLFLLRATTREREISVRRALGATYADIVRQLLVESILLAIAGAGFGLVVAEIARRVLVAAAPRQLPNLDMVRAAGAPIGAVATIALFTVLLFGIGPALTAARRNPASPLRLDARVGASTRQRRRVRQLLVGSQVALALIMLTGAGLLARSLQRLQTLKLGYQPDHLSVLELVYPDSPADTTWAGRQQIYDNVAPRLRALPGVSSITPVELPPFFGPQVFTAPWEAEGQSTSQLDANRMVPIEAGGSDYFRTFGIPILRGRGFLENDRYDAPKVAVVSASVARLFWPNRDPIGKRLRFRGDTVWRTVVGIAGDIHYRSLRQATPTVFLPWRQFFWQGHIVLRTTANVAAMLPAIKRAVNAADPRVTVWRVRTMDELLDGPLAEPRLSTLLLSMFGLVALALAAIGLYGIMASAVREQNRDIGVRMALGATPGRVRADVLRRALLVALGGAAVGIVAALAVSRVIASLLFEVSPADPVALLGACGVLLAVAAVAAFLPAYHASRVDPARALQTE